MSAWDNKRLSDIASRSQILIEGVKAGGNASLNVIIRDMFEELRSIVSMPKYGDLSVLSKRQLNELLRALNDVRGRAYSRYTEQAMEWLRDFCDAQASVTRRVWAYSRFMLDNPESDAPVFDDEESNAFILAFVPGFKQMVAPKYATDNDRLWKSVVNTPVPANGMYALPSFQAVIDTVGANVVNSVRKAWSTPGTTAASVVSAWTSQSTQGPSSLLDRTVTNSRAVLNTVTQFAAQSISQAIASVLFGRYRWDSIIDGRTSQICRSRNQMTYIMGQGPVPPAHINCRSHIAPIVNSSSARAQSLYTWLREQPRELLDYLFGEKAAAALLDGSIEPGDLPALAFKPMSYRDYMAQVGTIIN